MKYLDLLLLGLKLLNSLTAWMERRQFIEQGIALQVKANLEATDALLQKARRAHDDALASNPPGNVRRDTDDPHSRD